MQQPYPPGGREQRPDQPPEPPRPVLSAAKVMYAGAGLSVLQLILVLTTIGALRNAIHQTYPSYSASRVHSLEVSYVATAVIVQALAIGLWVMLSQACRAGKSWARTIASGLFGFNTLLLILMISRPSVSVGLAISVAIWLVGLVAILGLWRPDSSAYFQTTRDYYRSLR